MDKYKKEIEHFGMLHEYHDSEDYLQKNPHLACEDTANYLALWCINLEVQEVIISVVCKKCDYSNICSSNDIIIFWVEAVICIHSLPLTIRFYNFFCLIFW